MEWDIFIEEDFRARIENIKEWLGDGVIADYDDPEIESCWPMSTCPSSASADLIISQSSTRRSTIATDNAALVEALSPFEGKGCTASRLRTPASSGKRWAVEREYAFCQLVARSIAAWSTRAGDSAGELAARANRLADWLQTLPPQTGIIAVTDARARHVLQACELLHIPVPENCALSASITRS